MIPTSRYLTCAGCEIHFTERDPPAAEPVITRHGLARTGRDADVISTQTAEQMTQRGPRARVVEIEGCGHAPLLNVPEQQGLVDQFLSEF